MWNVQFLVILSGIIGLTSCARILAIVPVPSYSHQLFFRPIWKELAKRGHELTLLTTDPMKDPPENLRQIDWHFAYDLRHNKHNITKIAQDNEYNIPKILLSYQAMLNEIVDKELSHPEVQIMLKNETEYFDLLMVEYHHPTLYAFAERFNCPFITISSMEVPNRYHKFLGNPIHPVLYPEVYLPFEGKLTFTERLLSTVYLIYDFYNSISYNNHIEENMVRKYFGTNLPSLEKISRNVSLVFLNSNPVFNVRPLGPGFIPIGGGIHMEKPKQLPKNLEQYLNDATEGLIYLSLGTNVRYHHLTNNFVKAIVDTFKEIPYKVLWKFEVDIPEKPDNVKIVRWVPQQDVLRHKNVKLFITQCGIQSMEEAVLNHVPLIAIPFVSDQKMNSKKIENKGLGLMLDKNMLSKEILKEAILEVMNNPSYRNKIKEAADLIRDQYSTGLEKAVWWTEYVIRHKGVKHIWHSNVDLPLYQYLLIDVFSFFTIVLIIFGYIFYKIIKLFFSNLPLLYNSHMKYKRN